MDFGLISNGVKPMTIKLLFTASLLDALYERNSVENKPESLLVVRWERDSAGFSHLGVVDRWMATHKRDPTAH